MCIYSFLDTLTISGDTSGGEGRGKKSVLAIELPRSNLSSLHRRRLDRRPTKETRREQARSRNHTLAAFLLDLATNQDVDVYNFFFSNRVASLEGVALYTRSHTNIGITWEEPAGSIDGKSSAGAGALLSRRMTLEE